MKQYEAFTIVDAKAAANTLGRKDLRASKGKRK
jgi:hypothetical protein